MYVIYVLTENFLLLLKSNIFCKSIQKQNVIRFLEPRLQLTLFLHMAQGARMYNSQSKSYESQLRIISNKNMRLI